MAQAAHGSAPDIAGRDVANPISFILSMALLLSWHGERAGAARFESAARAIEDAVAVAMRRGRVTRDVGGNLGTEATGQAIVDILIPKEPNLESGSARENVHESASDR
jgi:3-isopropylmalate dehydrogenase